MDTDSILSGGTSFSSEAIKAQLERILLSRHFAGAAMRSHFLRFVVAETLAGRTSQIKQYTIAVKSLGRAADFDPHEDPIVRIQAGRVRRELERYYLNEGAHDPIIIRIPTGTYVPVFLQNRSRADIGAAAPATSDCLEEETPAVTQTQADGPIIAVLPFTNLSGDAARDFFVGGFGEELSNELTRFQDLRVIAYFSTAQLKEQPPDVSDIRCKLGADFVVLGSVRQSADLIRVKVSLVETTRGIQIWSQTFEAALTTENLFEIQEEIAGQIVGAVAGGLGIISREVWKASRGKRVVELSAYEAILYFYYCQYSLETEAYTVAREALERAVEIDPEYALAWATLGELYVDGGYILPFFEMEDAIGAGMRCAHAAIRFDPLCQHAYHLLAYIYVLKRNRDKVVQYSERVIELNPNSAYLVGAAAFWMCVVGEFERGLGLLKNSRQLNPFYPRWFHHAPLLSHLASGDYEQALEEANQFNIEGFYWDPLDKAAVLGLLGRRPEANLALKEVIQLNPDFAKRPRHYVSFFVGMDDLLDKMMEGLHKAGLPTVG